MEINRGINDFYGRFRISVIEQMMDSSSFPRKYGNVSM